MTAADLPCRRRPRARPRPPARVAAARERQADRFVALGHPTIRSNAACPANLLDEIATPDAAGAALLRHAADSMRLTARGYHRVLKIARTLADLDDDSRVGRIHLAEALAYRTALDKTTG